MIDLWFCIHCLDFTVGPNHALAGRGLGSKKYLKKLSFKIRNVCPRIRLERRPRLPYLRRVAPECGHGFPPFANRRRHADGVGQRERVRLRNDRHPMAEGEDARADSEGRQRSNRC